MWCDARGGGPEQTKMLCNLSGSDGFDNATALVGRWDPSNWDP